MANHVTYWQGVLSLALLTGRYLFDGRMFSQLWGPAVSAMCAIIDNVRNPAIVEAALEGLSISTSIAATHGVQDVADTVMANLAKIPMQVRSAGIVVQLQ